MKRIARKTIDETVAAGLPGGGDGSAFQRPQPLGVVNRGAFTLERGRGRFPSADQSAVAEAELGMAGMSAFAWKPCDGRSAGRVRAERDVPGSAEAWLMNRLCGNRAVIADKCC